MGADDGSVQSGDGTPGGSYTLIGEGQGRAGFVSGKAGIALSPDGGATAVNVKGEVQAGGAIARVGQRLIASAARMMMDRFFEQLKAIAEGRAERS
jgi:carbon monoxide dehydrogenase subunit G